MSRDCQECVQLDAAWRRQISLRETEVARLRECLRIAGLQAFMRDKNPKEIAEHLRVVAKSYLDKIDELKDVVSNLERNAAAWKAAAKKWWLEALIWMEDHDAERADFIVERTAREKAEATVARVRTELIAFLDRDGVHPDPVWCFKELLAILDEERGQAMGTPKKCCHCGATEGLIGWLTFDHDELTWYECKECAKGTERHRAAIAGDIQGP